jgi:multisubunit Na+/H+ antiporter MnhB subunit
MQAPAPALNLGLVGAVASLVFCLCIGAVVLNAARRLRQPDLVGLVIVLAIVAVANAASIVAQWRAGAAP